MTNFNFEGQPEGDWDDRGNLSWSELDWQRFLHRREKEIARFLQFYDQCPLPATERLDWVARQMGWDSADWSVSEFSDEEDEEDEEGEAWRGSEDNEIVDSDLDPYTLHRHPVYVVGTGLFLYLRYTWRHLVTESEENFSPALAWDFAESLNEAEKHCLMALQCMDMGDFLLCVVHLKRCLRGLNLAMSLVPSVPEDAGGSQALKQGLMSRLFDLREVFLRVMQDCRDEENRDFRD